MSNENEKSDLLPDLEVHAIDEGFEIETTREATAAPSTKKTEPPKEGTISDFAAPQTEFAAPLEGLDPQSESPIELGSAPEPDQAFSEVNEASAPASDQALSALQASAPETPLDAPPAGLDQPQHSPEADQSAKATLKSVGEFAGRMTIGHPTVEANPAFSLFAKGTFNAEKIERIKGVLTSDEYGVRFEDVETQLSVGKLMVPRISEYAAIQLGQKIFDLVDTVEIALSDEIVEGQVPDDELIDPDHFRKRTTDAHDLGDEPGSEADVFTATIGDFAGFTITRILSAITLSEIVPASVAEAPQSHEFEQVTEKLTRELASRAFKLGAHGVIGISFAVKLIEGYRDLGGTDTRAYRMLATGTAVKAKRNLTPPGL
ncbi:MAG TPA: hypothetical protein PLH57_07880 [Oligoflexia bacterium]|nr:hypothetical protein [Oligoflexia bacterium]